MKSKGSIFLPLISAVAVIAIVAATYFFFQNQQSPTNLPSPQVLKQTPIPKDETAQWSEIIFQPYYFSLKLPKGWEITTNISEDKPMVPTAKQIITSDPYKKLTVIKIYKTDDTANYIEFNIKKGLPGGVIKHGFSDEFDKIIATFKFSEPSFATKFDGCAKPSSYSNRVWFKPLQQALTNSGLKVEDITDMCVALNQTKAIFLMQNSYCGGPAIYNYEITNQVLAKAIIIDHDRGCLTVPKEFGQRNESIIPLRGQGGDAGCEAIMDYYYNLETHTVELKQERSRCQDEPWEETRY